ncbi:hypothetical protein IAR50_005358 [Cryptococcus sp. DSM 104548]
MASHQSPSSPREPVPTPPPLSLSDLFKNIQMPPPPTKAPSPAASASEAASVTSPPGSTVSQATSGDDQRRKLLGMLSFGGTPASGATTPAAFTGVSSPPVISHQSGIITSPPATISASPSVASLHAHKATPPPLAPESEAKPSLAQAATPKAAPAPKFSFISPFDAFDPAPSSSASPAGSHRASPAPAAEDVVTQASVPAQTISTKQTPKAKRGGKKEKAGDKVEDVAQEEVREEEVADPAIAAYDPSPAPVSVSKQVVVPSPSAVAQPKLKPVSEVKQAAENGKQDNVKPYGPRETASHITISLGKPNSEHIIPPTPGALNIQPITITKASDGEEFSAGKKVVVTRQFMGYTMSKGRIRLIDSRSGARLMLQTTIPTPGAIIDLAVTPVFVAALASDRSLWIWRVPPGWSYDNPPVDLVFVGHTSGEKSHWEEGAERVEWVKRQGADQLVVGGKEGVVVFNPAHSGQGAALHPASVLSSNTLLKADGPLVDFCINAQGVALGLLSANGHFTLYSLGSLNRVWARALPSSAVHEAPSGCLFADTNILVGRAQNTHWDLVQISTDIAVLSSIRFHPPPSEDKAKHWTKAVYDPWSGLLFVAPYLRNSVYALRYTLKGKAPLRDVSLPNGPRVTAFDLLSELPIASPGEESSTGVISLAMITSLGNQPGREEGDLDFVVKTDKGAVSLHLTKLGVGIAKGESEERDGKGLGDVERTRKVSVVEKPQPVAAWASKPEAPASIPAPKAKEPMEQQATLSHPLPVGATLAPNHPSENPPSAPASSNGDVSVAGSKKAKKEKKQKDKEEKMVKDLKREEQEAKEKEEKAVTKNQQDKVRAREGQLREAGLLGTEGVGRDEVESMLGEMEARLGKQIQQDLNTALFPITQKVEYLSSPAYLASLTSALTASLRSSLVPTITQNLGKEISSASKAGTREVVSLVGKEVGRKVDESVDSVVRVVVQEAVVQDILPVLRAETIRQTQAISSDLHSELLQLRKSLSPPAAPPAPKGPTKEELQEQKDRQRDRKEARDRWALWDTMKDDEVRRWNSVKEEMKGLKQLVIALQEQAQQGQGTREVPASAPAVPAYAHPSAPANIPVPIPPQAPHPPFPQFSQHGPPFPPPSPAQLTDTFIAVLSKQSNPETVQLVMDHRPLTDYILPPNGAGKSPLGQAVLLTVVHRLSTALYNLPLSPSTPTLLEWLRRSLTHLQPHDPEIESWAGRVLPLVRDDMINFTPKATSENMWNEVKELTALAASKID